MKNSTARKLREVPSECVLLGVDPHKKKHAVVVMTREAVCRGKFKVDNSRRGYEELLERGRRCAAEEGKQGMMFGIEAASHYWRNLAYFLKERGVPFRLINPFSLKRRREGKDINRRKNDFRDAEAAADMLRNGEFCDTRLPEAGYAELRSSYSAHCRLVQERSRLINLTKALLGGLFPEFTLVFKDITGYTAMLVLTACAVPKEIAGMTEEEFVKMVTSVEGNRRVMTKKLRYLHQVAGSSIGVGVGTQGVAREISQLTQRVRIVKEQIEETQKHLKELVGSIDYAQYLLSIEGAGHMTVAGLLAELGSMRSYRKAKQLIKMAGTNPTESESAGKRGSSRMSKKGRPGLRRCLWLAAISLLRHNSDFKRWAKERQERPSHQHPLKKREVIGAVANRFLRLVHALVRDKSTYLMPQPVLSS